MSDMQELRAQTKKCVAFDEIAALIEKNHTILLHEAFNALGIRVAWSDIQRATLKVKAGLFRYDREIQGWKGSFRITFRMEEASTFFQHKMVVQMILEALDIRPISISGLQIFVPEVELLADDWTQMLAYRRLTEID